MPHPMLDLVLQNAVNLINQQRQRNIYQPMDYVQLHLAGEIAALPSPNSALLRLLGRTSWSLLELEDALARIANDPRPKGVVLLLGQLAMSLADLETLRASLRKLRAQGKRVICYAQTYDLASYFVASVADEVWLQPGGMLLISGLAQQQVYLKDALASLGLEADVVAISPYKSAGDRLTRNTPSAEVDEQTNWLLDAMFDHIVNAIAEGRGMNAERVRTLIDTALYTDQQAQAVGLIDHICNEEGFTARLNTPHLVLWEEARNRLLLRFAPHDAVVAVLPVVGMIVNGLSNNPPVDLPIPLIGGQQAGDETIVQQVRHLMKQDHVKAVVVYVDSPGGSASASEAMASALDELAKTRPVVVCMGGLAASGGYYVSTSGQWLVAQPTTITGSIGVVTLKLAASGLWQKLRVNAVYYLRGANADILLPTAPFNEAQRALMQASIERIYAQFVGRVASARKLKPETVDSIGGGRVWTGSQALAHGLVDQLGGLSDALDKARALAGLRHDAPVQLVRGRIKPDVAQLAEAAQPAAMAKRLYKRAEQLTDGQAWLLPTALWQLWVK